MNIKNHYRPLLTKFVLPAVAVAGLAFSALGQATNITNGLVLWLPFTNTSGLAVSDLSLIANGTNAIGNDASLGNFPNDNSEWILGVNGNALNFNALTNLAPNNNEFAYVQDAPNLNFTNANQLQFTLACWFYCNSGAAGTVNTEVSGACLIDKGLRVSGAGGQQYTMDFNASYIRFYALSSNGTSFPALAGGSTNNPGAQVGVPTPFKPLNGVWYHIAGTYSGQTSNLQMSLYINGLLTNSGVASKILQTLDYSANGINIGNRNNTAGSTNMNAPFKGALSDVRIYNRVLTSDEVTNIVGLAFRPPTISSQPQSLNRYTGDMALFTAGINSVATTTFQWLLNGTNITNGANISGATNATLSLTNLQTAEAGSYTLVVSNPYGSTTSAPPAVLTISNLPPADTNSGLVSYWTLDEPAGTVTYSDSSGNGNSANNYGAVTTNGILNNCLLFGASTALLAPDLSTPDNGVYDFSPQLSFTLAAWVNGSTTQVGGSGLIAKGTGGGGEEYAIDTFGNIYRFFVRDASGTSWLVSSTNGPNGLWQHVAGVFDVTNKIMNLYINGQMAASGIPPGSMMSNTHELSVGARQSSTGGYNDNWTGDIDEVHIYNRALNAADIRGLVAVGTTLAKVGAISFSLTGSSVVNNTTVQFSGAATGGGAVAGGSFRVLESGDITVPLSQWTPVATNTFGPAGQFSFTVPSTSPITGFLEIVVP